LIVIKDPVRKLVDEFKSKVEFGEELFKQTIDAIVKKVEDSIDDVFFLKFFQNFLFNYFIMLN
jgi:hypothetical protein